MTLGKVAAYGQRSSQLLPSAHRTPHSWATNPPMTGVWVPCLHVYFPCCLQFRLLLTSTLQNLPAQGSNLSLVIVYSLLTPGTEVCLTAQFLRAYDRHVNAQEAQVEVAFVAVDTGKRCCQPTGCGPTPPLTFKSPSPPVTLPSL